MIPEPHTEYKADLFCVLLDDLGDDRGYKGYRHGVTGWAQLADTVLEIPRKIVASNQEAFQACATGDECE